MPDPNPEAVKLEESQKSNEALRETNTKLQEALDKALKRVDDAQKKISEWGQEIGDIRKERDELKSALEEVKKLREGKVEVKGEESTPKTPQSAEGNKGGQEPKPEDADTIESQLTADQRKLGETAFAALTDDEKLKYANDPAFRLEFLKRITKSAPSIPQTPWKTVGKAKGQEGGSSIDDVLDRVFARKRRSSYVPAGPQSGVSLSDGAPQSKDEPPEDDRVH